MSTSARDRALAALGALFVFGLTLAIRLPGLAQEAMHDELHHVLAARAYLAEGSLSIAGGEPYVRARPFTLAVAALFSTFGESLQVARLPALFCGALLASGLFLWLSCLGERGAGWIAAALLALNPEAINSSLWVRFYTVQHLCFLVGTAGLIAALRPGSILRRVLLAGATATAYGLAAELQVVSLIGVAGALGAAATLLCVRALARGSRRPLGACLAVSVLAVIGAWELGVLEWAREAATYTDLWAASGASQYHFYYGILLDRYPLLWPLFPLFVLLAAPRQPTAVWVATATFMTALGVQSLLAWKAWRYVEYAMPCFYLVVALGLAEALRRLFAYAPRWLASVSPWPLGPRVLRVGGAALALAVAGFALGANRAFVESVRLASLADPSRSFPGMVWKDGTLSWSAARSALVPLLADADVVVANDALKALYYLGRVDYELNRDHLESSAGLRPEFSLDRVTGRPVISEPESVARVMGCHRSGVLVAERRLWGVSWSVPAETADFSEAHAQRVELPAAWGLVALRWESARPHPGGNCPPLARDARSRTGH